MMGLAVRARLYALDLRGSVAESVVGKRGLGLCSGLACGEGGGRRAEEELEWYDDEGSASMGGVMCVVVVSGAGWWDAVLSKLESERIGPRVLPRRETGDELPVWVHFWVSAAWTGGCQVDCDDSAAGRGPPG